ncbi:MAG: tetratricopeptide repeat protein [Candidatus Omnitrophota bacterium]
MLKRIICITILFFCCAVSSFGPEAFAATGSYFSSKQFDSTYEYYLNKGDEFLDEGKLENAKKSFEKALLIQPDSEEVKSKLQQISVIARSSEGTTKQSKTPSYKKSKYSWHGKKKISREKAQDDALARVVGGASGPEQNNVSDIRSQEAASTNSNSPSFDFSLPESSKEFYDEYIDPNKLNNAVNSQIKRGSKAINDAIAPATFKGEYRLAFGAASDDFIWKDANADKYSVPGDVNYRYLFGKDQYNTYDKAVYSRIKFQLDNPITDTWSLYNEAVIDPWTFVGKKRVFVKGSDGDLVEMDLKYWSNTRSTLNETYRSERGDIINLQENKIKDGKTTSETYTGQTDWGPNNFGLSEFEIDRMYVPLRKSWVKYDSEPYYAKVFFMSDQYEALTSDDPMRLSNNKVWWEESSWLDTYDPSEVFERVVSSAPTAFSGMAQPLKKGQWIRNQSFVAKDSEQTRLTFLRGVSFGGGTEGGTTFDFVAAAPRNLWDTYDQATSIPAALRVKMPVTEELELGTLYTLKMGLRHNSAEAFNNLLAVDASYDLLGQVKLFGEVAATNMYVEEASGYETNDTGFGCKFGMSHENFPKDTKAGEDYYKVELGIGHMNDRFFPGLSNYRFTRKDFEYAKHIYFDRLNPSNEEIMFGDGLDIARNSITLSAQTLLPEYNIESDLDFRMVHSDGGDFIENAFRSEIGYKPVEKLTIKGLLYYLHLPRTTKGFDPLINAKNSYTAFTDYFAYEDTFLENSAVEPGKDPSIGAFSGGLNYDFTDYLSAPAIYEFTNDPKDWPRGLFNNVYVTDGFLDDVVWDKIVPFVYNQGSFGLPPYEYYNIYKLNCTYFPIDPLEVNLSYVYNENKYAMAVDDNCTHNGVELKYKPNNRLTLGFLYQYTRQRDIYREIIMNEGYKYEGHHNVFAGMDYLLNNDQHLSLTFGEYVGYDNVCPESHNSISALDTRHIVRVAYTGSWGGDYGDIGGASGPEQNLSGSRANNIPESKFITNLYAGLADYKTSAETNYVLSDWDGGYSKLEMGLDAYDKEGIEWALKFGLFGSLEDSEDWDNVGVYQSDDMRFGGADVNAEIGWSFSEISPYVSFTPLVNVGYRRVEFERSNFEYKGSSVASIGEVDEHHNISYLGVGADVNVAVPNNENLDFYVKGYVAPLVYSNISNDQTGTYVGDRGFITHAESGFGYILTDKLKLNLGGFWDKQKVDGEVLYSEGTAVSERPESELETMGLKLGGSYKF